jgi:hypothetical protein
MSAHPPLPRCGQTDQRKRLVRSPGGQGLTASTTRTRLQGEGRSRQHQPADRCDRGEHGPLSPERWAPGLCVRFLARAIYQMR